MSEGTASFGGGYRPGPGRGPAWYPTALIAAGPGAADRFAAGVVTLSPPMESHEDLGPVLSFDPHAFDADVVADARELVSGEELRGALRLIDERPGLLEEFAHHSRSAYRRRHEDADPLAWRERAALTLALMAKVQGRLVEAIAPDGVTRPMNFRIQAPPRTGLAGSRPGRALAEFAAAVFGVRGRSAAERLMGSAGGPSWVRTLFETPPDEIRRAAGLAA